MTLFFIYFLDVRDKQKLTYNNCRIVVLLEICDICVKVKNHCIYFIFLTREKVIYFIYSQIYLRLVFFISFYIFLYYLKQKDVFFLFSSERKGTLDQTITQRFKLQYYILFVGYIHLTVFVQFQTVQTIILQERVILILNIGYVQ